MTNTAALIVFSCMLAGGQLLFKRAGQAVVGRSFHSMILLLAGSIPMWSAVLLYGATTLLWVWILARMPLSQAYPWAALGTLIVPLAAALVFGETVRPVFWLGASMIAAGIVLTQLGAAG